MTQLRKDPSDSYENELKNDNYFTFFFFLTESLESYTLKQMLLKLHSLQTCVTWKEITILT